MRIGKTLHKFGNRVFKRPTQWPQIEVFDPRWKERIEAMLAPGTPYFSCEYTGRGPGTLVCDFNAQVFPDCKTAHCFGSGLIENVEDFDRSKSELLSAFQRQGFELEARGDKALSSQIFVFKRAATAADSPP